MDIRTVAVSLVMAVSVFWLNVSEAKSTRQSDDQIRQLIIEDSIATYPGVCACPFNSARNGSSCGRRSAWSKQGGYAPICYKKEVSKEMVDEWRKNNAA